GGEETLGRVVEAVRSAGLEPPTVAELEAGLRLQPLAAVLRHAAEAGTLVAVERDRYFSREAMERCAQTVRQVGTLGEITPGALRDRLGVSRKFLIPLLEWSDRQGITWRDAAGRRGLRPAPGPGA